MSDLSIDLNADLGEECGDDLAMLGIVTSANIACGMHAGNLAVMAATVAAATAHGVRCGAHPSYPDRENFGRTSMVNTLTDLAFHSALDAQLGAFIALHQPHAVTPDPHEGDTYRLPYIKPHGALYNDAARHHGLARHLAMRAHTSAIMHQPGSLVHQAAQEHGTRFIAEVFADRGYLADGTLAPRGMDGAVLHDPHLIAARVLRMVTDRTVDTLDGGTYAFPAVDSVCVHGDTPGAVKIARTVRTTLEAAGVTVTAGHPLRDLS